MADTKESAVATTHASHEHPSGGHVLVDPEFAGIAPRPSGWMYKQLGPLGWYASPAFQLTMVGFVCFLCPGMFNALNGIGGGGQQDVTTANQANIALYCFFCVVGFFAGSIVNRLGVKLTLGVGGMGYCVYVASFLCYNHTANRGFSVFAGAFLGFCAALLWAAQGAIMMSYPGEANKGKFIAVFWVIFNLGAVIGSLIPLGQSINNSSGGSVSDGTYAAFIVLTFLGAILAATLANADKVIRKDGSKVILMKHPTWKTEIFGLFEVLRTDWYIVMLFPMFFASNFFYTYHFQDVNAAKFTLRTRSLNGVLYWAMQMVGAGVFGVALDSPFMTRRTRAKVALASLFVLTFAIWGGGYAFQGTYNRTTNPNSGDAVKNVPAANLIDWTDSSYGGPVVLYMFYGFFDAAWQTCVYWFMGSLSNNSRKLANFAGFYKSIQSAGGAIAPVIENAGVPYVNALAANWGLLAGSLVFAAPVIMLKVRDYVPVEEDLKFTDETLEDVIGAGPPVSVRDEKETKLEQHAEEL